MKKAKKILLASAAVLLAVLIFVGVGNLRYLGDYKKSTAHFDIATAPQKDTVTVMSTNVRTWSPLDLFRRSWFYRADLITQNIAAVQPDIIGFQEVTKMHYAYLTKALSGYENVVQYRTDGAFAEACPVFWRTDRFTLKDKGSFWLSDTPDVMSKDWGSACYRVCSFVILTDKNSGRGFAVFNTHLDHISDEARINGIHVVLDKIRQFDSLPSVIMGDFNADESSETYRAATELFDDAKYRLPSPQNTCTYQHWGRELDRENIDYFMISKTGVDVRDYRVVNTLYDDAYPSDHFPIMTELALT